MTLTPEIKYCVKYLLDQGLSSKDFSVIAKVVSAKDEKYSLVKVSDDSFFDELAGKLRELWPPGEKDGKYPWRDSVDNLSKRLRLLWSERFSSFDKEKYTIDRCVAVAMKYLSMFEDDTKYMMTLKYFIMKQESIVKSDGKITYVTKSKLADMLESASDLNAIDDEWNSILQNSNAGEGELV